MIELNTEQFEELSQFLGYDPELEGCWAIIPSSQLTYCINSKGTYVIRLASRDCRGYLHKTRRNSFTQDLGGYLMCNIDNVPHKLHRLMAEIWLDDYNKSLTVNHKDGNKHNNDYHNLEMLTMHDNCMHYHNSSVMEEKRLRDYAYHGTTMKGRIHITNGIDSRMIYESEGIPDGWWKGRPNQLNQKLSISNKGQKAHNSGKHMITNGVDNKYIDIDEEIPEGWALGSSIQLTAEDKKTRSVRMQGRIYIHNGTTNKRIYEDELPEYVKLGWKRGMYTERYDPDSSSFVDFRGANNPFYGKKHSAETLIKLSNASKGRTHIMSDEAKKKISIANTGRIHTAESKKKMSEAKKGKPASNIGTIWVTNGITNKMIKESELSCYPEYHRGRTRIKS